MALYKNPEIFSKQTMPILNDNAALIPTETSPSFHSLSLPHPFKRDSMTSEREIKIAEKVLQKFEAQIAHYTNFSLGYPGNYDFDYTFLEPFLKYNLNNVGDPFSVGNFALHAKEFEQQCISWFAELYELKNYWGYLTSSGTEGNIYGLFLGRELYPDAILYASEDSHYSIAKSSHLLKIPHVVVKSQSHGEINYEHLEEELSKHQSQSAILNLNLGSTMKGAVDKIERCTNILEKLNMRFHIHCDAALGGMLLPFIEAAPKISFEKYPIGSIAVSGHKFIGSPMVYGIVLTRNEYVNKLEKSIEYIGSHDTTILGSRTGFSVLLLWYAIQTRGQKFAGEVLTCLYNAYYLRDRLTKIGYHPLLNDFSTTVVFEKPPTKICQKWQLATQGDLAHIIVMQHISSSQIDEFIDDLLAL